MPEYFDISLIAPRTESSKSEIDICIKRLGLSEGENTHKIFPERQLLVSIMDSEEYDFEELSIGIPEYYFSQETFQQELKKLTIFINSFFECNCNFTYGLCSYELNGYLIGKINKYSEFSNNDLLNRFPIVFEKNSSHELPLLKTNLDAQIIIKQSL